MTAPTFAIETRSTSETQRAGEKIASWLQAGDVVLLHGDLGAGKTTLAQGIAAGLGYDGPVSSPSFVLINEYEIASGAIPDRLFHVDLYRLRDEADLDAIGYSELITPRESVTIVEWPERARHHLPDDFLLIEFSFGRTDERQIRFSLHTSSAGASDRLDKLKASLQERD